MSSNAFSYGAQTNEINIEKIQCTNYPSCGAQAQIRGYLAGLAVGSDLCNTTKEPSFDFVWENEVKFNHFMGYLPIIDVLQNHKLASAFKKGFTQSLSQFKTASRRTIN